MHRSSKILQFCLVIYTIISQTKAQFQFLESFCTNSSTFALNSTYNSSINTLLQSLSANATYNPIGYYNISVGNTAENTVHGYFLCRGDLDNSACSACVSTMVAERQADSVTSYCPASKRQSVYYDKCMYRYSNNILYGQVTIEEVSFYKKTDKDITEEPDDFKESLGRTFRDLALKAANNQTGKKYATAAKKFHAASTSVYALVQCTPDLSVADCNACFNYAFQNLSLQYSGEMFMNPSCSARYESYPFFKGAVSLLSPGKKNLSRGLIIGIVVPITVVVIVLITMGICFINKNKGHKAKEYTSISRNKWHDEDITEESIRYDFAVLQTATNNFSDDNILGKGGFGTVYKGTLSNGQDIAVKKMSGRGHQGEDFKNEVLLVAKLQHKNLVRVLGFCLTDEEKLLIYEYVPNNSLNTYLFDQEKSKQLDWKRRYQIIEGIAKGMLYLHEDSRLKIIHRDLKASNVLLDVDMNPKVSDFGTARIVEADQPPDHTNRIVGTPGYIAPEYMFEGMFSVQSDVYSFGILVLEIISGKKAFNFFDEDGEPSLQSFAWKHWKDGTPQEFVDPCIRDKCSLDEVIRCMNLGLLSVQVANQRRPSMSTIVLMLNSFSATIPVPCDPMLSVSNSLKIDNESVKGHDHTAKNSTCQYSDDSLTMPR